jgi:7-carboxy-7-deazaguanine synthase
MTTADGPGDERRLARRLAILEGKAPGQLVIHEIYRSLQGESSYAGLPCVFVRLAACDLRCKWCDTPHAFAEGQARALDAVVDEVLRHETTLVELTGGEPLLQPEALDLMRRLADLGKTVLLETSGARDVSAVDRRVHVIMDLKCPDSGESDQNLWANLEHLKATDEIKLVVASRGDFEWAERAVRDHRLADRFGILFSAAFGLVEPVDLARWLLASGLPARMQLQMHKYVWDPRARGV